LTLPALHLGPGSRAPRGPEERDLLLRRVPEVALLPELEALRFPPERILGSAEANHAARIAELATPEYRDRLRAALDAASARAEAERNGGLAFVVTTLAYFLPRLQPERHPLVVALYFFSKWPERPDAAHLETVAELMDEHEERLGPMPENEPDPDGPSR
jgi:hypothetical protein